MKKTTLALMLAATSSYAVAPAVQTQLKDILVENDRTVCLNDSVYTRGQATRFVDDVADNQIDLYMDANGKITDRAQDTTAKYDLLIRINSPTAFSTNTHIIGVDDSPNTFNENSINNLQVPGKHVYKGNGLTSAEVDSLANAWLGVTDFKQRPYSIRPVKSIVPVNGNFDLRGRRINRPSSYGVHISGNKKVLR